DLRFDSSASCPSILFFSFPHPLAVAVIHRRGTRAPYFNSHFHSGPSPSPFLSRNVALGLNLPVIFFLSSPFSLSARD
ncbi:hypothetical protein PENTCL1PPCAC_5937, partial [Pristionchus entomophagus]